MKNNGKRKYVDMKVNGRNITCLLDTGSDISTIDETTRKKIGKLELRNTGKIARGISGSKLKFKGEFDAKVTLDGKTHKTKIYSRGNYKFIWHWLNSFIWFMGETDKRVL